MDESIRHRQEMEEALQAAALRHATRGVRPEELSAEGRFTVLNKALGQYLYGWYGLPPGFANYERRARGIPITYGEGLEEGRLVMHLAEAGPINLLITASAEFLTEQMRDGRLFISWLTETEVVAILADPDVLCQALRRLQGALRKRQTHTTMMAAQIEPHLHAVILD